MDIDSGVWVPHLDNMGPVEKVANGVISVGYTPSGLSVVAYQGYPLTEQRWKIRSVDSDSHALRLEFLPSVHGMSFNTHGRKKSERVRAIWAKDDLLTFIFGNVEHFGQTRVLECTYTSERLTIVLPEERKPVLQRKAPKKLGKPKHTYVLAKPGVEIPNRDLLALVSELNQLKTALGDKLTLNINDEGRLIAYVQYGD